MGVSWGYHIPGYRGILRISVSEDTVGILGMPRNPQDTIGVLKIRGILRHPKYPEDTIGVLGYQGYPGDIWYPQATRGVLGYQVSPGYPRVSWDPYPQDTVTAGIITIPPISQGANLRSQMGTRYAGGWVSLGSVRMRRRLPVDAK